MENKVKWQRVKISMKNFVKLTESMPWSRGTGLFYKGHRVKNLAPLAGSGEGRHFPKKD